MVLFVDVTQTDDAAPSGGALTLDVIRQLMLKRTGQSRVSISNPSWISEFRIHCRLVDRYRAGRVFLAGDAAHAHSPTGGQGIVTGIQDATNLAWKLARVTGGAPQSLLDTYEEERLPKAQEVLKETDRTTTVLLAPTVRARLVRDFLLLPIMRNGWVQKKMFAKLSQLHVNYRGCRLSQGTQPRWSAPSALRAGDRAPDLAFQRCASREITTLFAMLEPMRPIAIISLTPSNKSLIATMVRDLSAALITPFLLASPESGSGDQEVQCLTDVYGDFRRLYGLTGDFLCLIRPDDHIGLIQRPTNASALVEYIGLLSRAPSANSAR